MLRPYAENISRYRFHVCYRWMLGHEVWLRLKMAGFKSLKSLIKTDEKVKASDWLQMEVVQILP